MNRIKVITEKEFFTKYGIVSVDLIKLGFFSTTDFENWGVYENTESILNRVKLSFGYIPFILNNPSLINSLLIPTFFEILNSRFRNKNFVNTTILKEYNLRVSIALAFKPKRLFEIGTYLGWGAAAFKAAIPDCNVFSMNPKNEKSSNNPIETKDVGIVFRQKLIKVKQIWANSKTFNYSRFGPVDVCYIDGNHSYEYVLSDLKHTALITTKCILIDDYVPKRYGNRDGLVYGPWNEDVVRATDDFISSYKDYSNAFWIKGSKLAVIVK